MSSVDGQNLLAPRGSPGRGRRKAGKVWGEEGGEGQTEGRTSLIYK